MPVFFLIGFEILEEITKVIIEVELKAYGFHFGSTLRWHVAGDISGPLLRDPLRQFLVLRALIFYIVLSTKRMR